MVAHSVITNPRANSASVQAETQGSAPRRRLRIAHVTATYPPYLGGTGNVAHQNALELVRRGHVVDVLTGTPRARKDHTNGAAHGPDAAYRQIGVHRLASVARIGNAPVTPSLIWRVRNYDIIHLHYPYFFGAEFVALGAALAGVPYVITYHQDVLFQGALRHAERAHHVVAGRQLLTRAARLLLTSEDYGRASRIGSLLRHLPGRVGVLPNGVDAVRFRADIDGGDLRERYGLTVQDRVILFTGALDRPHFFKGVPVLLEALARLPDPSIKLLVVGDGDLRPEYEVRAQALGLKSRVVFCGRVSDVSLPRHYALADVQVLPSVTMGEAFGVVLLEAMATGKPVIASRLPGVRTVVADGVDGYLSTPGDAADLASRLEVILGDSELAQRMGAAGRAKVEAVYDYRSVGERLERYYFDVLAERSSGRVSAHREAAPDDRS